MRQLQNVLILSLIVCGPSITLAVEQAPQPSRVELQKQLVAASGRVEVARRLAMDARLRLEELNLQRRLTERPQAQNTPNRNPVWDRLAIELRVVEDRVRRLSDKLAPAHPEMQAAESELRTLKAQLESTAEFVPSTASEMTVEAEWKNQQVGEQITDAKQNLQDAESTLAQATEEHQLAMLALIARQATIEAPPEPKSPAITNFRTVSIWCIVGGACLLTLWALQQRAIPSSSSPLRSTRITRVDTPARRIVYPAANANPPIVRPRSAMTPRPKIVPRRRNASAISGSESIANAL